MIRANKAVLTAEAAALAALDPTIADIELSSYKYTTALVVNSEFLEDNAIGFRGRIGGMLGNRLANGLGDAFTTADGSSKPQGLVPASYEAKEKTGTDKLVLTYADFLDLEFSVAENFARNASWMMKRSTLGKTRGIIDTQGRPILGVPTSRGEAYTLLGYPVFENEWMDAIAAAKIPVLFGDFGEFYIRDVGSVRITVAEELYVANDRVGFFLASRHDSDLAKIGTGGPLNPMHHLAIAT